MLTCPDVVFFTYNNNNIYHVWNKQSRSWSRISVLLLLQSANKNLQKNNCISPGFPGKKHHGTNQGDLQIWGLTWWRQEWKWNSSFSSSSEPASASITSGWTTFGNVPLGQVAAKVGTWQRSWSFDHKFDHSKPDRRCFDHMTGRFSGAGGRWTPCTPGKKTKQNNKQQTNPGEPWRRPELKEDASFLLPLQSPSLYSTTPYPALSLTLSLPLS